MKKIITILLASISLSALSTAQTNNELNGVKKLQLDLKLDGNLDGRILSREFSFTGPMKKFIGTYHSVDGKPAKGNESLAKHIFSGGLIDALGTDRRRKKIFYMEHTASTTDYKAYYVGHVNEGKVVGTWYDSSGQSGDFVITL